MHDFILNFGTKLRDCHVTENMSKTAGSEAQGVVILRTPLAVFLVVPARHESDCPFPCSFNHLTITLLHIFD